jgi:hypothetical protein
LGSRERHSSRQYQRQLRGSDYQQTRLTGGKRLTSIRPNFSLMAPKVALTLSSEATSHPRPIAWISPGAASPCSTTRQLSIAQYEKAGLPNQSVRSLAAASASALFKSTKTIAEAPLSVSTPRMRKRGRRTTRQKSWPSYFPILVLRQ